MQKLLILIAALLVANLAMFALDGTNAAEGAAEGRVFTGKEDHTITLADAMFFMQEFRATAEQTEPLGGYFGGEAVQEILAQKDAVGLRYYYGKNEDKRIVILVGTDAQGNDMWSGKLAEYALSCPPWCNIDLPELPL